tara:strand:- start:474 stop:653 length:180 start_codon:yes stop_codon:yes gene_type:complete
MFSILPKVSKSCFDFQGVVNHKKITKTLKVFKKTFPKWESKNSKKKLNFCGVNLSTLDT